MNKIFVSGSMRIKTLNEEVKLRLSKMVSQNDTIVVGDANGVDAAIQGYLRDICANSVVVYCSGQVARNNIGMWHIESVFADAPSGSRRFFTAKDEKMAEVADFGFMVWDCKSTGTLNNVLNMLSQDKKSVVFVNKLKKFEIIKSVNDLKRLVTYMADSSLAKANEKIKVSKRIGELSSEQFSLL